MARQQSRPPSAGGLCGFGALPATFAQNKYDDYEGEVTFHLDVDPAPTLALREVIGVEVRKATAEDGRSGGGRLPRPSRNRAGSVGGTALMRQVMIAAQAGSCQSTADQAATRNRFTLKTVDCGRRSWPIACGGRGPRRHSAGGLDHRGSATNG